MAVMRTATYPLVQRSRAGGGARAVGGTERLARQARPRSAVRHRRLASFWRWSRHAAIAALVVTPILVGWVPNEPLSALRGPTELDSPYPAYAMEVWPFRLPQLGPPADVEGPLTERITQYSVAPGDTLQELAQRFGISTDTLVWANALSDPDRLSPGQELTVLPVSGVVHVVSEGESVAGLAERYGINPQTLIRANGLVEPYALHVNDRLVVPNGRPLRSTVAQAVPWPAPGTGVRFKQQFIEAAAAAAQESQRRSGVPASVAIAQAIHETGWGASRLAREAHNYFGIKGRNQEGPAGVVWMNTWEVIGGRNVILNEPFRAYNSPEESFIDHGVFLLSNRRYHGALAVANDPRAFARAIAAAGFATDPDYAAKIIRMMDIYDLYRYDLR